MSKEKKFTRGSEAHREHMRKIGRIGGGQTKARKTAEDPHYYENIGRSGSEVRIARAGGMAKFRKVASAMGKVGGKINAQKRWGKDEEVE